MQNLDKAGQSTKFLHLYICKIVVYILQGRPFQNRYEIIADITIKNIKSKG